MSVAIRASRSIPWKIQIEYRSGCFPEFCTSRAVMKKHGSGDLDVVAGVTGRHSLDRRVRLIGALTPRGQQVGVESVAAVQRAIVIDDERPSVGDIVSVERLHNR
ncbi:MULTISPECIES: hypothetical protein [unclassified Mycobacteroides]|uniref:hypothetical protein n=1 Tax=unclassified Mycobacteroides TaxID=2618759 RepID=UPI0012DBD0EC|nr:MULTISPECIES: hypothetical protein [unclassified Mycobacteroides]MUM17897.1 hypothetical protein [Mycobacteroides sp. CBMA 326]